MVPIEQTDYLPILTESANLIWKILATKALQFPYPSEPQAKIKDQIIIQSVQISVHSTLRLFFPKATKLKSSFLKELNFLKSTNDNDNN